MESITITRRLTTPFLQAVPDQIEQFNASIYAIVDRKPHKFVDGKYGKTVRIDPCVLNWSNKTIKVVIPLDINPGITSIDDILDDWYEAVQAAFLMLMQSSIA